MRQLSLLEIQEHEDKQKMEKNETEGALEQHRKEAIILSGSF